MLKRILLGASIFFGVAAFALALFLALTDFGRYRSNIETAVSEATGREFRIDGEFKPVVFPLSLVAEDISMANASWGSDEPFLTVGHVSVKIELASLFSRPIRISELRISDVTLTLEENNEAENNWTMGQDSTQVEFEADQIEGVPVIVNFAEIRNIDVTYRRPGITDRFASLTALDVSTDESNFINTSGAGKIDNLALSLESNIGPIDNLESGTDIEYDLEAYLGIIAISISGNSGNPVTFAGLQMQAAITADNIANVLSFLEIPADLDGPLRIESALSSVDGPVVLAIDATAGGIESHNSITFTGEGMAFEASVTPLRKIGELAGLNGLPDAPLTAAGNVKPLRDSFELSDIVIASQEIQLELGGRIPRSSRSDTEITVSFSTDNLEKFGAGLPDIPLSSTATASISDTKIVIDPFTLQFADSDASGDLTVQLQDPVSVAGEFHSSLLDLTPFMDEPQTPVNAPSDAEAQVEDDTIDEAAANEFVFTDEILPFEFLNAGSADLQVTIDQFVQGPLHLEELTGVVSLEDGELKLKSGFAVADGGNAAMEISLASRESNADLDVDLEITDLRLSLGENGERPVADIPLIGLAIDIESSGNSLRALAANSNGKVLLTQGAGKIDNSAMGFFSADIVAQLFGALNPFAKNEPYSVWECTVFALAIVDGVAEIKPMLAQSEKLTIVGDGKIDFNTEELDISFNTKPRRGVGVSADMFVTPFIRLGGSMAAPRISLDKSGVLISGGAAFLTGGISFFVQGAADRASGAADRCAAALALANGQEVAVE
jgi:uncharacterized protein involved in outer membrane biogenesis